MDALFDKIFEVLSLEYMLSVIAASYLILKLIDALNGDKVISTWLKRSVTCLVGVVLFIMFVEFTDVTVQCLVASFFAALFVYDSAIKTIIRKFDLDYRK